MKLPEGIGFTSEDEIEFANRSNSECVEYANAKLPALFEAWVKRDGVRVGHRCRSKYECFHERGSGIWSKPKQGDTHTAIIPRCMIEELK